MEYLIVFLLVAVVISLFDAMYYLARDSGQRDRNRVVKALTVRIGLSVLLFLVVAAGALLGLIEPHDVDSQRAASQQVDEDE